MNQVIAYFLAVESAGLVLAALVHFGFLVDGYQHGSAAMAESAMAILLALGLLASALRPTSTPVIGIALQVFAFLGISVGAFTVAIGRGPQTVLDVCFQVAMAMVLAAGVLVSWRAHARDGQATAAGHRCESAPGLRKGM